MKLLRAVLWVSVLAALCGAAYTAPLTVHAKPAAQVSAPVLKWQGKGCTSYCQTGWYASPAVADIDKDGQAEVIWGSYDLVSLNGATGATEWRASNGSRVWPSIAVADLTGNGSLEIIVGRSGDQLTVYNSAGGVLWARNPFGAGEVRTLAVANLEMDGVLDIVVGRASGGSTKQLNAFDGNGNQRGGWPARRDGEAGYGWGMYNQNAAIGDLNNDGLKEVIGPTDTHYITALDRNGNQLGTSSIYNNYNPQGSKVWSQVGMHVSHQVDLNGFAICGSQHRPNFANSAPVIADVNGDGTREIVVIGNVYNCATNPYTDLYEIPYILNANRTRWAAGSYDWTVLPTPASGAAPLSQDYNVIESNVPNPVVADLDGDGFAEILYPSYDGRLHAFWLDKTQHGSWPFEVKQAAEDFIRFASEPAVVDLDNNGQAEVIFTTWTEKGSNAAGQLIIASATGTQLHAVNLPRDTSANWGGAMAAPTVTNIDSDADLEVVIGTSNWGVVAYDLPNSANARILWGTGRGTFLRSGTPPVCLQKPAGSPPPALTGPLFIYLPLVSRGCIP